MDIEGIVDVEATDDVGQVPSGVSGFGHTFSLTASGQYSAMVLYRYHCRCNERPAGYTGSGRSDDEGHHDSFVCNTILSSSLSDATLMDTVPGMDASK